MESSRSVRSCASRAHRSPNAPTGRSPNAPTGRSPNAPTGRSPHAPTGPGARARPRHGWSATPSSSTSSVRCAPAPAPAARGGPLPETLYGRRKMTAWLDCSGFAGVSEHTVDRAVLLTPIRVKGLVSGVQHHRVDRPLADAVNVKQKLLIGTGETYPEVGLVDRSAWSLDGTGCQQHRTHNYLSGV